VLKDGSLHPVRVQPGISDGTTTALLAGDLSTGEMVVTGVASPGVSGAESSSSPLLPFGRGRFGNRSNASGNRGQGGRR
jgi:hypothetical protein